MPADPVRGRRWADHRRTLEAIVWKYRTCSPWRDLPDELGSFQTAHKRLIRWAVDGAWERILAAVLAAADADADIGWLCLTAQPAPGDDPWAALPHCPQEPATHQPRAPGSTDFCWWAVRGGCCSVTSSRGPASGGAGQQGASEHGRHPRPQESECEVSGSAEAVSAPQGG